MGKQLPSSLRTYRVLLEIGKPYSLPVVGNYIRFSAAKAMQGAKLTIKTDNGDYLEMGAGDFVTIGDFAHLEISSPVTSTVSFVVGYNAKFETSNITSTVQVINGELERVEQGRAFVRGAVIAAVNYAIAQLYNPAGSGVYIYLNQILYQCDDAALNVQFGVLPHKLAGATDLPVKNKFLGQPDLPINFNIKDSATQAAAEAGYIGLGGFVSNNNIVALPINEPIMIPEGYGVVLGSFTAGKKLNVSFQGTIS